MGKFGFGFGASRRTVFAATLLDMATSITQNGVTFTFAEERPVGQYANGDWWVRGPVTITSVTPDSAVVSGSYNGGGAFSNRVSNGLVLNPGNRIYATDGLVANNADTIGQGWDSLDAESNPSQIAPYIAAQNVDPGKTGVPLLVSEGTLVKAVSTTSPISTAHPVIDDLVTLSVVVTVPISDAIRPGYSRASTTPRIRRSDFDLSVFQNLAPTANAPTYAEALDAVDRLFEVSTTTEPNARNAQPSNHAQISPYGRDIGYQLNRAYLFLHLSTSTDEQRLNILVRLAAIADDLVAAAEEGKIVPPLGGGNGWKKPQIAIVAAALGANAPASMLEYVDFAQRDVWMLDGQIQTVTEEDVTTPRDTSDGRARTAYEFGMVGATEWMEQGDLDRSRGDSNWVIGSDASYRPVVYGQALGGVLATLLTTGAKALWNHDALFDYFETVFLRRDDSGDPGLIQDFVEEMIVAYWPQSAEVPVIEAAVLNASEIALKFSIALDEENAAPTAGDFAITLNGSSVPVTAVSIFRDTVGLTIDALPIGGDTLTVAYTAGTNALLSVYQVPVPSFAAFTVTNRNDPETGANTAYPVVRIDPATRLSAAGFGGTRTQGVTFALLEHSMKASFANGSSIFGNTFGSPNINMFWYSNGIEVFLSDNGGTGGLKARFSILTDLTVDQVQNIVCSVDLTQPTAQDGVTIYINGVETVVANVFAWTQDAFVNMAQTNFMSINRSARDFEIGAIWVDDSHVDLSVAATRDKFLNPPDMGLTGDGVTGSDPVAFLVGDAAQWNTGNGINRGTGNKFAIDQGTVTDVSGNAWGTGI